MLSHQQLMHSDKHLTQHIRQSLRLASFPNRRVWIHNTIYRTRWVAVK